MLKAITQKIILEGIVGSTAYGLATENSDIDKLGLYVAPTQEILSLRKPEETIVKNKPDITYHEVEKFMNLALKCNPTVLELLFLENYEILTDEGIGLLTIKDAFLSNTIKNSYGGYAVSQARKLNIRAYTDNELNKPLKDVTRGFSAKTSNRPFKHARHCFRLLQQGKQLLETGTLKVKVDNRNELMALENLNITQVVALFEIEFEKFNKIKSVLPDKPDYGLVNAMLLKIRKMN